MPPRSKPALVHCPATLILIGMALRWIECIPKRTERDGGCPYRALRAQLRQTIPSAVT